MPQGASMKKIFLSSLTFFTVSSITSMEIGSNYESDVEITQLLSDEIEKALYGIDSKNPDASITIMCCFTGRPYTTIPLHFAAEENKIGLMRSLISKGADINIKDAQGRTPLFRAVNESNLLATQELLKQPGIEIDSIDSNGNSLLHAACAAGVAFSEDDQYNQTMCNNREAIVQLLLQRKLKATQKNNFLDTPLDSLFASPFCIIKPLSPEISNAVKSKFLNPHNQKLLGMLSNAIKIENGSNAP